MVVVVWNRDSQVSGVSLFLDAIMDKCIPNIIPNRLEYTTDKRKELGRRKYS